jgi:hypothetical protein
LSREETTAFYSLSKNERINNPSARKDMLLCKKIKIEVSKQDAATLEFMQGKCRGLYNWWVMKLRSGEYWPGWEQAKKTLQESREFDPEINAVYGKLLQEVFSAWITLCSPSSAGWRRAQRSLAFHVLGPVISSSHFVTRRCI